MKRSHLALAVAAAALAISASGPAYAQPVDDTVMPVAAAPVAVASEALPAIASADIHRVTAFAPAPRLTYAVLVTSASPQALALGSYRTSWSIA
jgi:hypothetical protein